MADIDDHAKQAWLPQDNTGQASHVWSRQEVLDAMQIEDSDDDDGGRDGGRASRSRKRKRRRIVSTEEHEPSKSERKRIQAYVDAN